MSIQGYLVNIKNKPVLVSPKGNIFEKQGQKQFWFFLDGKNLLAKQGKSGWAV